MQKLLLREIAILKHGGMTNFILSKLLFWYNMHVYVIMNGLKMVCFTNKLCGHAVGEVEWLMVQ